MKVIFFDRKNETRTSITDVLQLQSSYSQIKGRPVNVWLLVMAGGKDRVYKKRDFEIERIEK